jgi:cytochrome c oxidase subunit II
MRAMSRPISTRSGIADALAGWPPPVLDPAGPYAESVTTLAWALLAMWAGVFLIVLIAVWIALKGSDRLRARLGGEKVIWIGGVAFPLVVLTALLIWGLWLTRDLEGGITGREMRVRVSGEMWWWRVAYVEGGRVALWDANELHIPVGRPVVLELTSADVVHSFWVPRLSGKRDMIPGRTNLLRIQADKPGRFGGICAEYCGGPHALMGFVVIAHTPQDWERWRASRLQPRAVVAGEAARGAQLFASAGCGACHRVAGTSANGLAGPDLTFVGSRATLGAGILPNNRGTLMGWIGNAQAIKPGNRMPSYDVLSGDEIRALAAYLETLK